MRRETLGGGDFRQKAKDEVSRVLRLKSQVLTLFRVSRLRSKVLPLAFPSQRKEPQ